MVWGGVAWCGVAWGGGGVVDIRISPEIKSPQIQKLQTVFDGLILLFICRLKARIGGIFAD